jgi:hypothetical protein
MCARNPPFYFVIRIANNEGYRGTKANLFVAQLHSLLCLKMKQNRATVIQSLVHEIFEMSADTVLRIDDF